MRRQSNRSTVRVEQLEQRWLLSSYRTADYFPMPTGATWTYAGRQDGDLYTETKSYSPATFNGHAVICDATTDVKPTGTTRDRTYDGIDAAGVRIYGEQFTDTDGSVNTLTFTQPIPFLNNVFSDGQVMRWYKIPVSLSVHHPNGSSETYQGVDSGTVTVNGGATVLLPEGRVVAAVKLTMDDTMYLRQTAGERMAITFHDVNIGWQAKGLNGVRSQTTTTVTYDDGTPSGTSTDSTTLTAASLLLDFSLSSARLPENRPAGTVVGSFRPLFPIAGADTPTYTLLSTATYPDNAAFTIVGNQLLTAKPLNYEAKRSYSLGVRATDAKGASYAKTVIVSIVNVNEAPTVITLSRGWVAENQPAGTLVGLLSGSDPDAGSTLRFSLVGGDGAADNAAFKISGTQLLTTQRFNYDRKSSYSIRLRVTDQGGLTHEKAVTISVAPTLLAARLVNGTLSVHGSAAADHLNLTLAHGVMTASINGHSSTFQAAQVQKVLVYGLSGNDSVNCSTLNIPCTVWGGAGNDTLTGSQADDVLYGGADNDVLYGQQGNNSLDGGAGDDKVYGGAGNDNLSGGTGHNTLSGGDGDDVLYARNGIADTLDGGSGSNSAQVDDLIDNVANIQNPLA